MTRKRYPIVQPPRPYDVVGNIIAYENSELDRDQTIELFQHLIDSGMIPHLQGHYQYAAQRFIEQGMCHGHIKRVP